LVCACIDTIINPHDFPHVATKNKITVTITQELEAKLQKQGQTVTSLTSFKFNATNYGSQPLIKLTSPKTDRIAILEPADGEVTTIIIKF
jgi:hypothetical protein